MNPSVSVIIPLYNAEKYVYETITSVQQQSFQDIEILIIDNGSTDRSIEIVNELALEDSRMKVLRLERNSGGPAKPRNMGIDMAKGEFLAFLDADDIWCSNKLELQLKLAKKTGCNFLCGNCSFVDNSGASISVSHGIKGFFASQKLSLENIAWNSPIITSSVLLKSDFVGVMRFDEDPQLVAAEDLMLWMELLNKPDCVARRLPERLLKYRVLSNSKSREKGKEKAWVLRDYALSKFMLKHGVFKLYKSNVIKRILRLLYRQFTGTR